MGQDPLGSGVKTVREGLSFNLASAGVGVAYGKAQDGNCVPAVVIDNISRGNGNKRDGQETQAEGCYNRGNKSRGQKGIFKSWSFPSGDAASVFAAGAVLAFAMPWPATIVFAVCCCGVAILRVVALAHYPSDVLGGAATGILSGWSAIFIRNRYPGIENIFKGRERILSFIGVVLILILIWLLQGLDKLIILLEFYAPIVLIIAVVDRRGQLNKT